MLQRGPPVAGALHSNPAPAGIALVGASAGSLAVTLQDIPQRTRLSEAVEALLAKLR